MLKISMVAAGLLLLGGAAQAQLCAPYANTFVNGQTTNAPQLMANLEAARTCLNNTSALFPFTPQGRLTLTSGTPVMAADVVAATTVYYTPYVGNRIPIRAAANMAPFTFSELALSTVGAGLAASSVYDVFVFSNGGVPAIGFGPAWSTPKVRSAGLWQYEGLWTNVATITLKNGSTTYAGQTQSRATYVGTVATTAASQLAMQFNPAPAPNGNNTWLGVWNAYNRTMVKARSTDSTASWSYSSATLRASQGSLSNRINWIDGLSLSRVIGQFNQVTSTQASGASTALGLNSTTTAASGSLVGTTQNSNAAAIVRNSFARDSTIQTGFNFIQALESAPTGTATFYGSGTYLNANTLELRLDM